VALHPIVHVSSETVKKKKTQLAILWPPNFKTPNDKQNKVLYIAMEILEGVRSLLVARFPLLQ
jgi:hypothetical protein